MTEPDPLPRPQYEPKDAQPAVVAGTACALAAIIGLCMGVVVLAYGPHHRAGDLRGGPDSLFQHGPDQRSSIDQAWQVADREVQSHLGGYAWVDRPSGRVRIPVSRAIDLGCAEQEHKAATAPAAR